MGQQSGAGAPSFEWYVQAQHLLPRRIYRVEVRVDDRFPYAVGGARTDDNGNLTAHGTLVRFADQLCVGAAPVAPQPLTGHHTLSVGIKNDGSGDGPASMGSPLTDPTRALTCKGNGDGNFDYWLVSRTPITLGTATASR